jgi:uncharacterized protein YxeA
MKIIIITAVAVLILVIAYLYASDTIFKKRKLQYLRASDYGLIAYFDDGSVVDCPRCEYSQENFDSLSKKTPTGTWDATKPPELFIKNKGDLFLMGSWVVEDYKLMTPP